MEGLNYRKNYADSIWFCIKQQQQQQQQQHKQQQQQQQNELSRDVGCIFEMLYMITIYNQIAANKVLLNIIIPHINVVTEPTKTFYFLSRNIQ